MKFLVMHRAFTVFQGKGVDEGWKLPVNASYAVGWRRGGKGRQK
jgi:hypothetical protein